MSTSVPTTKPPGEGWKEWGRAAYGYVEVETWQYGDKDTRVLNPRLMHPATNVYGLKWRPAGPQLTPQAMNYWIIFGTNPPRQTRRQDQ